MIMTVDKLIEHLKVLKENGKGDHDVYIHVKGAPCDNRAKSVYVHPYDVKLNRKRVMIGAE